MKKILIVLMLILSVVSLVACANKTSDVGNQDIDNKTKETVQQDQDETPTQPPKPTLSEEEKRNLERYSKLFGYCEKYKDWSAAILIKEMFDEGKISNSQYAKLCLIESFEETRDLSDDLWKQVEDHVKNISSIINGHLKELNKDDLDQFYKSLCAASQQGAVYINIFDSQEKMDRVIKGVAYINKWLDEPSDENLELVKEIYFSEDFTPGEVLLLSCHLNYFPNENSSETRSVELAELGITEYSDQALESLLQMNNA